MTQAKHYAVTKNGLFAGILAQDASKLLPVFIAHKDRQMGVHIK